MDRITAGRRLLQGETRVDLTSRGWARMSSISPGRKYGALLYGNPKWFFDASCCRQKGSGLGFNTSPLLQHGSLSRAFTRSLRSLPLWVAANVLINFRIDGNRLNHSSSCLHSFTYNTYRSTAKRHEQRVFRAANGARCNSVQRGILRFVTRVTMQ